MKCYKPSRLSRNGVVRVFKMMRAPLGLSTLTVLLIGCLPGCVAFTGCHDGKCAADAEITSQVQALFRQHPALEPPNLLEVRTLNHVVYLYGLVDTDLQRQLAESVTMQANGVSRVVDSIGISGNR